MYIIHRVLKKSKRLVNLFNIKTILLFTNKQIVNIDILCIKYFVYFYLYN